MRHILEIYIAQRITLHYNLCKYVVFEVKRHRSHTSCLQSCTTEQRKVTRESDIHDIHDYSSINYIFITKNFARTVTSTVIDVYGSKTVFLQTTRSKIFL